MSPSKKTKTAESEEEKKEVVEPESWFFFPSPHPPRWTTKGQIVDTKEGRKMNVFWFQRLGRS